MFNIYIYIYIYVGVHHEFHWNTGFQNDFPHQKIVFPTIVAETFGKHTNFSARICLNLSKGLVSSYLARSEAFDLALRPVLEEIRSFGLHNMFSGFCLFYIFIDLFDIIDIFIVLFDIFIDVFDLFVYIYWFIWDMYWFVWFIIFLIISP